MNLDPTQRATLATDILAALERGVPTSRAELRGSLATGRADAYSDIDVLWDVPDHAFLASIAGLPGILSTVRPLAALRTDPDFAQSPKHRLLFARFANVPLFWRVDIEVVARSINRDTTYDRDNPDAQGILTDLDRAQSTLANAVAAIKAHLRGDDADAQQLLARAYHRIGASFPGGQLDELIVDLADTVMAAEPGTLSSAEQVKELASDVLTDALPVFATTQDRGNKA